MKRLGICLHLYWSRSVGKLENGYFRNVDLWSLQKTEGVAGRQMASIGAAGSVAEEVCRCCQYGLSRRRNWWELRRMLYYIAILPYITNSQSEEWARMAKSVRAEEVSASGAKCTFLITNPQWIRNPGDPGRAHGAVTQRPAGDGEAVRFTIWPTSRPKNLMKHCDTFHDYLIFLRNLIHLMVLGHSGYNNNNFSYAEKLTDSKGFAMWNGFWNGWI